MKTAIIIFCSLFFVVGNGWCKTNSLKVTASVSEELLRDFKNNGRIFLFINANSKDPRRSTWPNKSNIIFATNLENWDGNSFIFDESAKLTKSGETTIKNIQKGKYYIQVLWDQDFNESRINAPGNLHSKAILVDLKNDTSLNINITEKIGPRKLAEHELLKEVDIKSEILSEWWGKEMRLKAAIFLPRNYFENPDKKYPVRYNIAG